MNRRDFLKVVGIGTLAFVGGHTVMGRADEVPPQTTAVPKPRPPGTCGGWLDANADGVCDHSVREGRPCLRTACPGHGKNPDRAKLKAAGAPAGVCARWADPKKTGHCVWSLAADRTGCRYALCPAHRNYEPPKPDPIPAP